MQLRGSNLLLKNLSREIQTLEKNTRYSLDDVGEGTEQKINKDHEVLQHIYLPDDICYNIMKWLDGKFVIGSCFLVSRQWYRVATTDHSFSIKVGGINQVEELMKQPWISRVHSIDLYEECGDDTISMIGSLSNLSKLVIPNNCLTLIGYETLSNNFNLTELDVRGNTICQKGFENICKQSNLTRLNISDCKLKDLTYLTQLENLTFLKLGFSSIYNSDLTNIDKFKNLKVLNLSGVEEVKGIKLSSLNQLTRLDLSSCEIGLEDIQEITKLSKIVKLNVSYNSIGDSGVQQLINLKNLKRLDVSSTDIEIEGVESICGMKQLTCLKIGRNNIGSNGLDLIVKNLKNLTELDIRRSNIGMGVRSITELPKLTSLDIRCNDIGFIGIDIISSMKKLRKLQVSDNFKDREAKCLSEMKNLTCLNVGYNTITSTGVIHISKMKNLTELNITNNNIGLKGTQALTSMSNLTNLSISFFEEDLYEKGKKILAKKKFAKLDCILFRGSGQCFDFRDFENVEC